MNTKYLTGVFLLCAAGPALAQQERPTLTLEDAIRIAHERNPSYRRAMMQVNGSEAQVMSAWGQFLPTLNADLNWNGSRNTVFTGTDDFGGTLVQNQSRTITSSNVSQRVSTSLTLFDGLRNVNDLRAAKSGVVSADAWVAIEELRVDAEVSNAFYAALVAERRIEVEERLLGAARDNLDTQQRRFRIGASDRADVLGAEIDLARAEVALERAISDANKQRLVVLQRIGVLGEIVDFAPVGELPDVFEPSAFSVDEIVTIALQLHPSMAQSEANLMQAQRQSSSAKGARWPTISANGGFARSFSENGYAAFFDVNPQNRGFNFGLGVSIPILNNFSTSQAIAQAKVNEANAEETLWENRVSVEQSVRSALIDLQTAHQEYVTQTRATDLARRRLEISQEQFRAGALTFINLQTIINSLSQEERSLVNAHLTFLQAVVNLEQRVGQPIPRPE
ncbi:MAG: TolC family protein [Gemmatimonadetes bacterium]|nr:TolC family protein [Gemmatimonadota bacterium]